MRCKSYSLIAVSTPIWVCLTALSCMQPGRAEPPRDGEFRLSVQVWRDHCDGEQTQVERRPLSSMFVFSPEIRNAGARRNLSRNPRLGFKEWLVAVAEQTSEIKKEHAFSIKDGKVNPSRVVGSTSDIWTTPNRTGESLWIQTFANPAWGGASHTEVRQTLKHPEPTAIIIASFLRDAEPAYALVLDHPVAKITNENGLAFFDRLPIGVDIPLRTFTPGIKRITLLKEVEGVEIQGAKIVVFAKDQKDMTISLLAVVENPEE
jgi:hypothetical protein